MLCAINREKPDRLPVSAHPWQAYHLDNYLGGISDLEAFEKVGSDGGYICALSDHFFETLPEKLQAFADAGRQYRYLD